MIIFKKYYIFFFLALSSCGLFSTRDPASPDTGKSTYIPPNSAEDVVTNFKYAVVEKNAENYKSCFLDTANSSESKFTFTPSPDAYALYKSLFDNWDLDAEKRTFYAIISKLPDNKSPQLELTNYNPVDQLPDYWTITYDYKIIVQHNVTGLDTAFAGTLQFVIIRNKVNGYWYIQKWIDNKPPNDSIPSTWSILKAQFAN